MKKNSGFIRKKAALLVMTMILTTATAIALPAFPGAEGMGSQSKGGRGGEIIRIKILNGSGPGSLKEAMERTGPRIVVFEVGGAIMVDGIISPKPNLTVAGETAPSPGITLYRCNMRFTNTNDIIIRHLRTRVGKTPSGMKPNATHCFDFGANVQNVIIDHCSASWAMDENVGMSGGSVGSLKNVTFSNCIISECLRYSGHEDVRHSKGMLIHLYSEVSIIKSLFAHNDDRNPLGRCGCRVQMVNNVIYNPGYESTVFWWECYGSQAKWAISLAGNVYKKGPDSDMDANRSFVHLGAHGTLYYKDNIALNSTLPVLSTDKGIDTTIVTSPEKSAWATPISILPASQTFDHVMQNAGARPFDRDGNDTRVINDAIKGTGKVPDSLSSVGGFFMPKATSRTLDIPPSPSADDDKDGYTNIEEWLSEFANKLEKGTTSIGSAFKGASRTSPYHAVSRMAVDMQGRALPEQHQTLNKYRAFLTLKSFAK